MINSDTSQKSISFAVFAATGAMMIAVALGAGIVTVGAGSITKTLFVSAVAIAAISAVACLVLEVSIVPLVRFTFVASFFFKGEINLFKIDEIEDPSGLNISLALITALILLGHDFIFDENSSGEKIIPTVFSLLFAGLVFCAGVSVLYSETGLLGWYSVASLATSMLTAYVVAAHFGRRERLGELIAAVAAGLSFTGAAALSQYVFDFPTNLDFFGTGTEDELIGTQSIALSRVPAFLRTPTEMAWVVSALLPLALAPIIGAVKEFHWRQKILLAVAASAGAIAIILSLARGSWFGSLAAVAVLLIGGWFALSQKERNARMVPTGAAILLLILLLAPFADRIYERLTADDDGSAAIRLPLLEVAGRMIADNPLVGVGVNNYRGAMTKYDDTGIFVSQIFPNPVHNLFAHVTAEIGIPGGILFVLLIIAALVENLRMLFGKSDDRFLFALTLAVAAGLVAFVISAMKEPGSLGSARPAMRTLFLLFGLTLALSRLRRQSIS